MKGFTSEIPKVDAAIEHNGSVNYFDLFQWLADSAEIIKNDTTQEVAHKLFVILAKGCSLIFSTENADKPLVPYIVMPTYQSVSIEGFTPEELAIYGEIVHYIEDYRLQARIADILYLAPNFNGDNKQRIQYANIAVSAYEKFSIDEQSWFRGGKEAIERLCYLGLQTQGKKQVFHERLTERILNACLSRDNINPVYTYGLANLLYKYKLGKSNYNAVAEKIRTCGDVFLSKNNHRSAILCYELSCNFYKRLDNREKLAFFYKLIADTYERELPYLAPLFGQENLVKAKAALKLIPRTHKTDDILLKIGKLDAEIEELRELAHTQTIESSCEMDIAPYVIDAKKIVSGLDKYEALLALLKISHISNKEEIISSSIARIRKHHMQYYCKRYRFHRDGRLLEKYDGEVCILKELNEENPIVKEAAVKQHDIFVGLSALGRILPALEVLHQEHRYTFADFLEICETSSIIPTGRSDLFAKGLHFGYNYDFTTASHILAPQFEHLVRKFLKNRGVRTTIEDSATGKVDEKSLSALVGLPDTPKFLGKNLTFTIASLFCDDRGTNIRNEIAHGLVDSKVGNLAPYIYAWWLIFRLIAANQFFVSKIQI
ncbi:MAG: DUF4209 domain-containing protein [Tyzzerella sp.]|nr:DUF4209 domain-containing protein [Tyzzerella sp.]